MREWGGEEEVGLGLAEGLLPFVVAPVGVGEDEGTVVVEGGEQSGDLAEGVGFCQQEGGIRMVKGG